MAASFAPNQLTKWLSSGVAWQMKKQSLLAQYARRGAYTDCYSAKIARTVSAAEYVEVFYTRAVQAGKALARLLASRPPRRD
jgi:hypothetical protein